MIITLDLTPAQLASLQQQICGSQPDPPQPDPPQPDPPDPPQPDPAGDFDPILHYEWTWAGTPLNTSIDSADMGMNGCVVVAFTVPDGLSGQIGAISTAEYPGSAQRLSRTVSLS